MFRTSENQEAYSLKNAVEKRFRSCAAPVFKTGLDLTQPQTQTRVAGTSCCRGAAYGANTLKAENSRVFSLPKASINHLTGTVCAGNDGALMTRPPEVFGLEPFHADVAISSAFNGLPSSWRVKSMSRWCVGPVVAGSMPLPALVATTACYFLSKKHLDNVVVFTTIKPNLKNQTTFAIG